MVRNYTDEEIDKSESIYNRIPIYHSKIYNRELKIYEETNKPRPDLSSFYNEGLLKKEQLEHGKYYLGYCRNAIIARWNQNTNLFYYVRTKFGDSYEEDIPHPEDCDGHDIFVPIREIEPSEGDKVTNTFD
jgi:hypothetical protein